MDNPDSYSFKSFGSNLKERESTFFRSTELCNEINNYTFFSFVSDAKPNSDIGHHIVEVYTSHTLKHTPGRTPLTSDQLVAEAATCKTHNEQNRLISD
jgi:hypothetical protein